MAHNTGFAAAEILSMEIEGELTFWAGALSAYFERVKEES